MSGKTASVCNMPLSKDTGLGIWAIFYTFAFTKTWT